MPLRIDPVANISRAFLYNLLYLDSGFADGKIRVGGGEDGQITPVLRA